MPRPRISAEPRTCRILAPHKTMTLYNPKGQPRPAQGLPRSWIGQKLVLPKTMVPPNPSSPQTTSGQAISPQDTRIPARGGQHDGYGRACHWLNNVGGPLIAVLLLYCCSGEAADLVGGRRQHHEQIKGSRGFIRSARSHGTTARTDLTVNCKIPAWLRVDRSWPSAAARSARGSCWHRVSRLH